MPKKQKVVVASEKKPSLQFKTITVAKKGINGGISGGGYQCC